MYNPITTEDFDKWIKADSREFEVKCEYVKNGTTYTMVGGGESGQIISMEWNKKGRTFNYQVYGVDANGTHASSYWYGDLVGGA